MRKSAVNECCAVLSWVAECTVRIAGNAAAAKLPPSRETTQTQKPGMKGMINSRELESETVDVNSYVSSKVHLLPELQSSHENHSHGSQTGLLRKAADTPLSLSCLRLKSK